MEHSRAVGQRPRIPSDSRHLLGLGQALLRRGKQMSGRTHGEPRATRLLMGSPPAQTPALLWCRCSGHGGLRSSATSANDRLCPSCCLVKRPAEEGMIGMMQAKGLEDRRLRPPDRHFDVKPHSSCLHSGRNRASARMMSKCSPIAPRMQPVDNPIASGDP